MRRRTLWHAEDMRGAPAAHVRTDGGSKPLRCLALASNNVCTDCTLRLVLEPLQGLVGGDCS